MMALDFHSERLRIRSMDAGDWRGNQAIITDFNRSACRIYDMPLPEEDGQLQALTEQWSQSGLFFSVFLADTPEMIGYICFHKEADSYDLGYCFHSAYQGKGYAYESCSALMGELAGRCHAKRFTAHTALENTASCRLLEKLGFTLVESNPISFHKDAQGNDIPFSGGSFIKEISDH